MIIGVQKDTFTFKVWTHLSQKLSGLPFFLVGSFFFIAGLTTDKINDGPPTPLVRFFFCSFSLLFILFGLSMICGFTKVIINRRTKTIKRISGVIIPFPAIIESFSNINRVELKTKVERNKDSDGHTSYTTYFVAYLIDEVDKEIEAVKSRNLLESRRSAEKLSRLFKVVLIDWSLGIKIERDHDELEHNIKELMKKYDVVVERPDFPEELKAKISNGYSQDGNQCSIISLGREFQYHKKRFLVYLSICSISLSYLIYRILDVAKELGSSTPILDFIDSHFSILTIVPILISLACINPILKGIISTKIIISRRKIIIKRNLILTYCQSINMSELEHVLKRITFQKERIGKVTLVSDNKYIETAFEQKEDVLDYIVQQIKYMAQNGR